MILEQDCGCRIVVDGFPASIEFVRVESACIKHIKKETCGFCEKFCGNDWCCIKDDK